MPDIKFSGSRIIGLSACVPEKIFNNSDYFWLSKKERQQFIDVTGIEKRHIADKNIIASDMCQKAAEVLLRDLNIPASEIGILIFVSQSRDYYLPQTSAILQHKLGISQSCMAVDISLGCSGYINGLSILCGLLETSDSKYGLLLAGDISTRTTPYTDKSTFPLFGDAGTATIVEKSNPSSSSFFNFGNDGSRHEAIIIRDGYFRNGISEKSLKKKKVSKGIHRKKIDLELNGIEVFRFSITEVPVSIRKIFKTAEITTENIDYFVLHQANKIIIQTIGKILKIPPEKIPINLDRYGNTSVGSIPLCMVTELREQLQTKKLKLLLSGFGVGLSWGSAVIETDNIHVSELQYI